MSNHFKAFRQVTLGYILIVGLCVGLVTPTAQAEAPHDNSYAADALVDGLTQEERAAKIDAFFASRENAPLAGYGIHFVKAADKYGLTDWELIPAIATIETSGGKNLCKNPLGKNNPFGYGSCKIGFDSFEDAIDTVTKNLAGHNPATEKYYKGKTTKDIIDTYNPPSVRHDYNYLVTYVMNKIEKTEVPAKADTSHQLAVK